MWDLPFSPVTQEHNCVRELRAVVLQQQTKIGSLQTEVTDLKMQHNESKRELQLLKALFFYCRFLFEHCPTKRQRTKCHPKPNLWHFFYDVLSPWHFDVLRVNFCPQTFCLGVFLNSYLWSPVGRQKEYAVFDLLLVCTSFNLWKKLEIERSGGDAGAWNLSPDRAPEEEEDWRWSLVIWIPLLLHLCSVYV